MLELLGSYRATDLRFLILMKNILKKMPVICFKLIRNNKHGKMGYALYVVSCSEKIFVTSFDCCVCQKSMWDFVPKFHLIFSFIYWVFLLPFFVSIKKIPTFCETHNGWWTEINFHDMFSFLYLTSDSGNCVHRMQLWVWHTTILGLYFYFHAFCTSQVECECLHVFSNGS